jgi:hypothetical protein
VVRFGDLEYGLFPKRSQQQIWGITQKVGAQDLMNHSADSRRIKGKGVVSDLG